MEPKEAYGVSADQEKMASGPRAVTLPWFLPFFDQQDGETQEMRLAYRQMLRDPVVKGAVLGKLYGVAALDIKIAPVSDEHIANSVYISTLASTRPPFELC